MGHFNATGDLELPQTTTAAIGYMPPSFNNSGCSSSLYHLSNSYSAGARSSYQAIQPLTDCLATFDSQFAHTGEMSETSSYSTIGSTNYSDLFEAIGTDRPAKYQG